MIIGLYDADFDISKPIFNIDLMKLSTYYKRRGEIVKLSPLFIPDKYTKFIYGKNIVDGHFHKDLVNFDNVERYGYAFHPNKMIPLPPEIECLPADVSIYNGLDAEIKYGVVNDWFNPQMNGCHVRISADGKTVYPDWGRQINMKRATTLICHDKNIGQIENEVATLKAAADRLRVGNRPLYLKAIYPIQIGSFEEYRRWEQDFQVSVTTKYLYHGAPPMEFIEDLSRPAIRAGKGLKNRFVCRVDERSMTNHFLDDGICKIFIQLIFLRSHKLNFSLVYEDNYFMQQGWGKVIDFLNYYFCNAMPYHYDNPHAMRLPLYRYPQTMINKTVYSSKYTADQYRNIFAFVRENNYELFKLFYECGEVRLEGGELVYDKFRD